MSNDELTPEGLGAAEYLCDQIKNAVTSHSAPLRDLIPRKYSDEEWVKAGRPILALFARIEITLEMLHDVPSSTLLHFTGMSVVSCHVMCAHMLGIAISSEAHLGVIKVIAAAMKGNLDAGSQSLQ